MRVIGNNAKQGTVLVSMTDDEWSHIQLACDTLASRLDTLLEK